LDHVAVALPAIEFLEDEGLFRIVHPAARVYHARLHKISSELCCW
jgi:hypothetical protein